MKNLHLQSLWFAAALALAIAASISAHSLTSPIPASTGAAARLSKLDPLPFFHGVKDSVANKDEGAGSSCSLYVLYGYVMQRTGRRFDPDEFVRFRRWAIEHKLFFPKPVGQVVDFDSLAKRLPEFFGDSVQSLEFRLSTPADSWVESAAESLANGHAVIAMTAMTAMARGDRYSEADHVITLVEPVRGADGRVEAFLVADSDSYEFWESVHLVTVGELAARLARPKALVDAGVVAIAVTGGRVYLDLAP